MMHKTLLAGFFLVAGGLVGWSAPGHGDVREAFLAGDFATAIEVGEDVVASGDAGPMLFFELGNAYFRDGRSGLAALNFRRALAADPGFVEAAHNLQVALEGKAPLEAPRTWVGSFFGLAPANVFAVVASVAGWLALVCLVAWWFRREKIKCLVAAAAIGPVFFYGLGGVLLSPVRPPAADLAMVVQEDISGRFAPAETAAVVSPVPTGSEVRLLSKAGAWAYIELPDSRRAWIPSSAVRLVLP